MENENKQVKRFALLAWLLAACLVTMATLSAQAESEGSIEDQMRSECGMGVTVGAPIRGG